MPKLTQESQKEHRSRASDAMRWIAELRNAGIRDEDIAAKLKVSWRAVYRWRKGEAAPQTVHYDALGELWAAQGRAK